MNIKQKLIKEFFENYIDRATGKIYLLDKAQLQPKLEQLLDDYKQQVSVEPEVKVNLPTDKETAEWFDINIDNDSASSAIYKFRLWLNKRQISA